jgi:integrase
MTITDFVQNHFVPEHVAKKSLAGRTHYQAILKHVLTPESVDRIFGAEPSKSKLKAVANWPYLDQARLEDVQPEDVQQLISAAMARGYSIQTVTHIRNVVGAIFEHARRQPWFHGANPAAAVALPTMTRKEARTLTLSQTRELLGVMQYPEREMTLVTVLMRLNVAEICGLQWKYVNLEDEWTEADGEMIPPRTIAVRQQWNRGELAPLEQKSRNRNLPIAELLLPVFRELRQRARFNGPDDFVLVSRNGSPVNMNNIRTQRLKPIGELMQMPWLSWQVFHRTHMALANEFGTQFLRTAENLC